MNSPVVEGRFRRLTAEWKEKSRYLSNTAQMAMLMPYQRIIGLGMPAFSRSWAAKGPVAFQ